MVISCHLYTNKLAMEKITHAMGVTRVKRWLLFVAGYPIGTTNSYTAYGIHTTNNYTGFFHAIYY